MKRYFFNILIWLDQGSNAVLGGDPDETLSSRFGKAKDRCRVCRWACWLLDRLNPDHCAKSLEPDQGDRAVWRW